MNSRVARMAPVPNKATTFLTLSASISTRIGWW
jgi:hypothetical protein